MTKRRQHLMSLGPFLFAGGGDVATWCRESSSLVVIVPVEDVVMKVVVDAVDALVCVQSRDHSKA